MISKNLQNLKEKSEMSSIADKQNMKIYEFSSQMYETCVHTHSSNHAEG